MTYAKLTRILILGLLLVTLIPSALAAQSVRRIIKGTLPSVVVIVMQDAGGREVSLGSGFIVRDGIIAASLHTVEGAARGYYRHVGYKKKFSVTGIVGVDRKHDLVLLSVPDWTGPPLALGDDRAVAVGDKVYVIGHPGGLEGSLSEGIVSGMRQTNAQSLLQISAPLSVGSSGSPVLNEDGRVIGLAVATVDRGQNLNFAVPIRYLRVLLSNMQPVMPLIALAPSAEQRPRTARADAELGEALAGTLFTWDRYGPAGRYYSFSLRNRLNRPVQHVYYMVAFYDGEGQPVDVQTKHYADIIPAGFAKRVRGALEVYTSELVEKVDIKIVAFEFAE